MESCYGSVSTHLVFTSKRMLPVARKNVLPTTQNSFVVYNYKCDSCYVEQTPQQLQDCIKQHVTKCLRQQLTRLRRSQPEPTGQSNRLCKRNDTKPDCDCAIGQHLLENEQCAFNYDNKRFSILFRILSFRLNRLEPVDIKTQCLMLRKLKEFVYTFKLFRQLPRSNWASCCVSSSISLMQKVFLWRALRC